MRVEKIAPETASFRGATININALSDTHGHIELADSAYQTMMTHDLFEKEEKGKKNFLLIGGDWFISGGKKGYKSAPDKPLWEFQADILNKFLECIKTKFPNTNTLFIAGNHEFDDGEKAFISEVDKINSKIIIGNLDFENSKGLKKPIEEGKLVKSDLTFVPDDKDKNITHPVLNLGVCPVNMGYYLPFSENISFIDNIKTPQKEIKEEEYQKTEKLVEDDINSFKKTYPKGTVILTCHTGVNFADNVAKNGGVDIIFDGHEHKVEPRFVNNTPIIPLSQNFKKLVNAKIKIDDEGKKNIEFKSFDPTEEIFDKKGEVDKRYREIFKKDLEKIYTIKGKGISKEKLSPDNIRQENNDLANFVTDIILNEIRLYDKNVDIFAVNSSAIRGEISLSGDNKATANHLEILKCLEGLNYNSANLYKTSVKGDELIKLILDNLLFNDKDKEKNPIMQYSGIKINREDFIKDYKRGENLDNLCKYVILSKDEKSISPNKTYNIANVENYFIKTNNSEIKDMKKRSTPMNLNAVDLFVNYFEKNKYVEFTPDTRLY